MSGYKHLFIRFLLNKVDGVYTIHQESANGLQTGAILIFPLYIEAQKPRKINGLKSSSIWDLNLHGVPDYSDQVSQTDFSIHGRKESNREWGTYEVI